MLPTTKGSFAFATVPALLLLCCPGLTRPGRWRRHEDFCGHKGTIGPGDLQWMTAGKGILHSEMPANKEVSHGLQLWVNLANKEKLCDPAYQELKAKDIPVAEKDG